MFRLFLLFLKALRFRQGDRHLEAFLAHSKQTRRLLSELIEECNLAIVTLDALEQRAARLRAPPAPEPRPPQVLTSDHRQAG